VPLIAVSFPLGTIVLAYLAGKLSRLEAHHAALTALVCIATTGLATNIIKVCIATTGLATNFSEVGAGGRGKVWGWGWEGQRMEGPGNRGTG
jgi:hypothetical protein